MSRSEALPSIRRTAWPRRRGRHLRLVAGNESTANRQPEGGRHESSRPQPSRRPRALTGVRVIVVDDDRSSVDYFAMALGAAGAIVTTASSAAEALRAIEHAAPDVVLSDIAMPGRDGYWLVRAIREHADAKIREVPVVATTAHGYDHSRDRALAAGFVDHLPKPVDPEVLWAGIARAAAGR